MLSIVAVLLIVSAAGYSLWRAFSPSDAGALSRDRTFIDAKTGKAFQHELAMGDLIPVDAPSGGKTGFPGELCYWTKDGQTKKDPTVVLLKNWTGERGPTFCPDCGRLVVGHNPPPGPGIKPPPLQSDYKGGRQDR